MPHLPLIVGFEVPGPAAAGHDDVLVALLDAAPGAGKPVTAGFVFDVPARFDTEALTASLTAFKAGQAPSIPLVEVRL